MGLGKLKVTPKRLMSVDMSTNSLAYCIYDSSGPTEWGQIDFSGENVFTRAISANRRIAALKQRFDCDTLAIEPSVYVNNRNTVIAMAYVAGAIISTLGINEVYQYIPIVWQKAIGNPPLTAAEKHAIKEANPNKSKTWLSNEGRELRKRRTMDWVRDRFGIEVESNDVSDAIAIGWHAAVELGLLKPDEDAKL